MQDRGGGDGDLSKAIVFQTNAMQCIGCHNGIQLDDIIFLHDGRVACRACFERNQRGPRPNNETTQWTLACILADQQNQYSILQGLPWEVCNCVAEWLQDDPWETFYVRSLIKIPENVMARIRMAYVPYDNNDHHNTVMSAPTDNTARGNTTDAKEAKTDGP